jgi:hypothetical protein
MIVLQVSVFAFGIGVQRGMKRLRRNYHIRQRTETQSTFCILFRCMGIITLFPKSTAFLFNKLLCHSSTHL